MDDRIFSTSIDLDYSIELPNEPVTIDGLGALGERAKFSELQESVRKITLETFATDESASVQVRIILNTTSFRHNDVVSVLTGHDVQDVAKIHREQLDCQLYFLPTTKQALHSSVVS